MNIEMLQEEINTAKNFIEDLKTNDSRKVIIGTDRFGNETIIFIGNVFMISTNNSLYPITDEKFVQSIIDDFEECTVKTSFKRLMKSVIEREENRIKEMEEKI